MITWTFDARYGADALGLLPDFISAESEADAVSQIDANYGHGGGWRDFSGFALVADHPDPLNWHIQYPEDPPVRAIAYAQLRSETIILFQYSWVAVVQPDLSFRVARID